MQTSLKVEAGKAIVKLSGRFDFNTHRDFRAVYEKALDAVDVREVVVDLGGVEYLDSSALGMLLLLRDKCQVAHRPVSLANCKGAVKQVLEIANFDKLFRVT